jgi:translation initiation factor 2B subunit (eIF-2B alpha/beta/delta family)
VATSYKILGQAALTDNTDTVVYTVPAATQAVVSTVAICNQSASTMLFKIAFRPSADGSTTAKHYFINNASIDPYTVFTATIGATLATGDKVIVSSAAVSASVSVFGSEIA